MTDATRAPLPNLYLVGFMGVGKSVLGRATAQRLGMDFVDSDAAIEAAAGKAVAEIFAQEGEPAFREREREFVEQGHASGGLVVACGGGLVVQPGMLERLRRRGVIIHLEASVATLLERTRHDRKRPLLNVPDPEARIRELLDQRLPIYRAAGPTVRAEGRPPSAIVDEIIYTYREAAERFRPTPAS